MTTKSGTPLETVADAAFDYVWWGAGALPERAGQPCRIVPVPREGTWDAVLIAFGDGFFLLTSKLLIRPAEASPLWQRGTRPGSDEP